MFPGCDYCKTHSQTVRIMADSIAAAAKQNGPSVISTIAELTKASKHASEQMVTCHRCAPSQGCVPCNASLRVGYESAESAKKAVAMGPHGADMLKIVEESRKHAAEQIDKCPLRCFRAMTPATPADCEHCQTNRGIIAMFVDKFKDATTTEYDKLSEMVFMYQDKMRECARAQHK